MPSCQIYAVRDDFCQVIIFCQIICQIVGEMFYTFLSKIKNANSISQIFGDALTVSCLFAVHVRVHAGCVLLEVACMYQLKSESACARVHPCSRVQSAIFAPGICMSRSFQKDGWTKTFTFDMLYFLATLNRSSHSSSIRNPAVSPRVRLVQEQRGTELFRSVFDSRA